MTFKKSNNPDFKVFGFWAWIIAENGHPLLKWYSGEVKLSSEKLPFVNVCIVRWLYKASDRYRNYVDDMLAHEHHHASTGTSAHEPDEARDVMSPKVWNRETDKHNTLQKSIAWRKRVRATLE